MELQKFPNICYLVRQEGNKLRGRPKGTWRKWVGDILVVRGFDLGQTMILTGDKVCWSTLTTSAPKDRREFK